jgi:hypothetical protein
MGVEGKQEKVDGPKEHPGFETTEARSAIHPTNASPASQVSKRKSRLAISFPRARVDATTKVM